MKKKKKVLLSGILLILIIIIIGSIIIKPYYKIEDRRENIKKFDSDNILSSPLGWLRVQGTNIDFPIIYYDDIIDARDPVYELGWNFENKNKLANRTVILSHNMRNVSSKPLIGNKDHQRFEQLMAYIYYDFVKENKYIEYTINEKNELFKIYGVSFQKEENVSLGNIKKSNMNDYIKETKNNSYFKFDVDVNENDKLLTLVTCTRFFGDQDYSFVVDARKVRKNELIKNYKVTEKSNYKKIKKKLKGDDKNE